jgi:hypothetical protein
MNISLKNNPRPDTSNTSRIGAISWLSAQAICGIPEAAKVEEEMKRLQRVCLACGATKEEVYQINKI